MMAKELGLTPEQQVKVDSIMSKQRRGIRKVTDAAQPAIDSLTREAQQAMDSVPFAGAADQGEGMAQSRTRPRTSADGFGVGYRPIDARLNK